MPKRFKFRYQTVLEVREQRQKAEEEALQRLIGEQRREEALLQELRDEEALKRSELIAMQNSGTLEIDMLFLYQHFLAEMERRIRAQQEAVELVIARVDNQRNLLADAMREAEVLRKLKERDEKAWREGIELAEAQLIDELAMGSFVRKQDNGAR